MICLVAEDEPAVVCRIFCGRFERAAKRVILLGLGWPLPGLAVGNYRFSQEVAKSPGTFEETRYVLNLIQHIIQNRPNNHKAKR